MARFSSRICISTGGTECCPEILIGLFSKMMLAGLYEAFSGHFTVF